MKLLSRAVMWGLLFCVPVAATANEQKPELEMGAGLICNSEAQVERYLALNAAKQAPDQAVRLINDEAQNPNACALAAVAFIRGAQGKSINAPGGLMKVTKVMVLAVQTPAGWQRVPPIVQFTAIFEKLEEA